MPLHFQQWLLEREGALQTVKGYAGFCFYGFLLFPLLRTENQLDGVT